MIQTIITIIKENFPTLLSSFEKNPFVLLTLIFIGSTGYFARSDYITTKEKIATELVYDKRVDSLQAENNKLKIELTDSKKYEYYNQVIDSTLKTMFINNLIKKNNNDNKRD